MGEGRSRGAGVTVVVANVLGDHCTQVPLADDQYADGEIGSQGADEPLGDASARSCPA